MRHLTASLLAFVLPVWAPLAQAPSAQPVPVPADTAAVTRAAAVVRARAFLARERDAAELLLDRPVAVVADRDVWRVTFNRVDWQTRRPAVAMVAVALRGGAVRRVPLR